MKVLVIPDIHLKPNIFLQAAELMRSKIADKAVCLMDIADDFGKQYDIELYEKTYDEAIRFAKEFPETLWCYGNHDLSYIWHQLESGYSSMASHTVQKKMLDLKLETEKTSSLQYVHKIDDVIFCHGGVSDFFVRENVSQSQYNDVNAVVTRINTLGRDEMWNDASPIWLRPQHNKVRMYKPRKILQVVGHTPMERITKIGNIISCDVFSTYPDGTLIGTPAFLLLDTITWEYTEIKYMI